MDCCSLETDLIYLHPDESGRIIHVGPNTVKWVGMWDLECDASLRYIIRSCTIHCKEGLYFSLCLTYCGPSSRMLRCVSGLKSDSPSEVVEDFSITTCHNNVSVILIHSLFHMEECTPIVLSPPLMVGCTWMYLWTSWLFQMHSIVTTMCVHFSTFDFSHLCVRATHLMRCQRIVCAD